MLAMLISLIIATSVIMSCDRAHVTHRDIRNHFQGNTKSLTSLAHVCRKHPRVRSLRIDGSYAVYGDDQEDNFSWNHLLEVLKDAEADALQCSSHNKENDDAARVATIFIVARGLTVSGQAAGISRFFGVKSEFHPRSGFEPINENCIVDCWYTFVR